MAVCPNKGRGIINFNLAPGDVILVCPYDSNHRFLKSKLVKHLDKCRLAYGKKCAQKGIVPKIMKCPYSNYHEFPKIEYDSHLQTCIYKSDALPEVEPEPETDRPVVMKKESEFNPKPKTKTQMSESEECWDDDPVNPYATSYNPLEYCRKNRIPYLPSGMTRSERRKFRAELIVEYTKGLHEINVGGKKEDGNFRPKYYKSPANDNATEEFSSYEGSIITEEPTPGYSGSIKTEESTRGYSGSGFEITNFDFEDGKGNCSASIKSEPNLVGIKEEFTQVEVSGEGEVDMQFSDED